MARRKPDEDDEPAPRTPPARTPLQQKILDALPESIDIEAPPSSYKLAGWMVAGLTALLPLIYIGLIFLVGHGIYWHYKHDSHWLTAGGTRFFAYWLVYVIGVLTVAFLIKPFFRWNRDNSATQSIKRSVEPFLYDYIEALCHSLGAPVPKSIQVDLSPTAAAVYRFGIWGVFVRDMSLVIGLPLVLGMSVRQVSGILAHEFGHLSQGFGMRLSYVSDRMLNWYLRAAFERDWFDEKLASATGSWLGYFFQVVRFFIWLSRQFLIGLLWIGYSLNSKMAREMEFDADGYFATLVGSQTFAKSFSILTDLNMAHQMAIGDVQRFYEEGRIADNFPALIVSNIPHIKPEFRKAVRKMERERKANRFDSHPPDVERIARARDKGPHGLLKLPGEKSDYPATVLFAHLGTVCRAATTEYYREVLGSRFRKTLMHPVEKMIERREQEHAAGQALDRYFLVHVPVDRPLTLTEAAAKRSDDSKALFEDLKRARETMIKHLLEYRNLSERYSVAITTMFTSAEALSIIDCGLNIKASDFDLPDRKPATAEDRHERARASVQHLAQRMLVFEEAASDRLQAALRLLQTPKVAERVAEGANLAEEMREVIPQAVFISTMVSGLPSLRVLYRRIAVLFNRFVEDTSQTSLLRAIFERMENLHTRLKSIRDEVEGKPYPFDHADVSMNLQRFVIPHLPEENDLDGLMNATEQAFERLFTVQVRMYAKLAQAAEKVEVAIGLPPLEDPDEEKKAKKAGESDATLSTKKEKSVGGIPESKSKPAVPKPLPKPTSAD
jgi:Zn-dependent protease with chaperone function